MIENTEISGCHSGARDIVLFCGVLPRGTKFLEKHAVAIFTLAVKQEGMSCNLKIFPESFNLHIPINTLIYNIKEV